MSDPVPALPARSLDAAVADGALVLDVREDAEWDAGHLPGSVHVPLADLGSRLAALSVDAAAASQVVVVCRVGGRSAAATAALRSHGLAAVNLDGGLLAYTAAGGALRTPAGAPGRVL